MRNILLIGIFIITITALSGCVNRDQQLLNGKYVSGNDTIYFQENNTFVSMESVGSQKLMAGYWGIYDFNIGSQIVTLKYVNGYVRIFELSNNSMVITESDSNRKQYEKKVTS
jgi:hypothetical protein